MKTLSDRVEVHLSTNVYCQRVPSDLKARVVQHGRVGVGV